MTDRIGAAVDEDPGLSLRKFLDELRNRNMALKYALDDAEAEIEKRLAN